MLLSHSQLLATVKEKGYLFFLTVELTLHHSLTLKCFSFLSSNIVQIGEEAKDLSTRVNT